METSNGHRGGTEFYTASDVSRMTGYSTKRLTQWRSETRRNLAPGGSGVVAGPPFSQAVKGGRVLYPVHLFEQWWSQHLVGGPTAA